MEPSLLSAKFLGFSFYRRNDAFSIPARELRYLDLTYCLEGSMEYIYRGERVTLHAGDAILYPVGAVRERLYTDTPNYYASFNVEFDAPFLPQVCGYLPHCVRSNTMPMLEMFREEYNSVSPRKQEKCAALFSYLYYQLAESVFDKENAAVRRVRQYLSSHLSERITLEQLAAVVHLSPNYLCSLFKQETGWTIMEYLLRQRVEKAKRMMVTEEDSLSLIAEKCGFSDYNYFSQTFRKLTGTTAMQYRKAMRTPINKD